MIRYDSDPEISWDLTRKDCAKLQQEGFSKQELEAVGYGVFNWIVRACSTSKYRSSKLEVEEVLAIRNLYGGNNTYQSLANTYKVNKTTIRDIILRRTWDRI